MRAHLLAIFFGALSLTACVATAPVKTSQEISIENLANSAHEIREGTAEGSKVRVGFAIESALYEPRGPEQINELFALLPKAKSLYLAHLDAKISKEEVSAIERARGLKDVLERSRQGGVLTPTEATGYLDRLAAVVGSSDALKVSLLDVNSFPQLNTPERRPQLATQSVASYKSHFSRADQLVAIVDYVKSSGIESSEGSRISAALLAAGLRRAELPLLERELPPLADRAKQYMFVKGRFAFHGGDRLLADDVRQVVQRRTPGVLWSNGAEPDAVVVTVERVRHEERTLAERRDTVTYAQHQVNFAAAVLLMPRNASYLYDISTSGSAIDYGYVVKVEAPNSPVFEQVVRGTAEGQDVRCSNARIQNVFGGVQAAEFVANEDMAVRCRSGNGKSMGALRADVYDAVADSVRSAPAIRRVIDLD
jgi:hypothetical protein